MDTREERAGTGRTDILIPAAAAQIRTGDTPEWNAALAAHHDGLVSAGVTAWVDEGKKLTAPPRPPRKTKKVTTAG